MKKQTTLNINILLPILEKHGYTLRQIPCKYDFGADGEKSTVEWYFAKANVKSIDYWYVFGERAQINLGKSSPTSIRADADNVATYDYAGNMHPKLSNNDYISPRLSRSDDYIGNNEKVQNWLLSHGCTPEDLNLATYEQTIYESVTYPGVPTPYLSNAGINNCEVSSYFLYDTEDLVLDEREIEVVLNSIQDKVLKEKIKLILYARVFKHQRY